MRARGALAAGAALAAASFACCDCGPACGPDKAEVASVIDGDTIVLAGGEKVRYLLVDTPETTSGKEDCYGPEAREFNKSLVLGRTVTLGYDKGCRDRYGRLLAYATVDGREVNSLLVERGFGCVLYVAPSGESRKAEFEVLQTQAKSSKRGLWGFCVPPPCG